MPATKRIHLNIISKILELLHPSRSPDAIKEALDAALFSGLNRDHSLEPDVGFASWWYHETWLDKKRSSPWECTISTKFPKNSSWRVKDLQDEEQRGHVRKDMAEDKHWSWFSPNSEAAYSNSSTDSIASQSSKRDEQLVYIDLSERNIQHISGDCACDDCLFRADVPSVAPCEAINEEGFAVCIRPTAAPSLSSNAASTTTTPEKNRTSPGKRAEIRRRVSVGVENVRDRLGMRKQESFE